MEREGRSGAGAQDGDSTSGLRAAIRPRTNYFVSFAGVPVRWWGVVSWAGQGSGGRGEHGGGLGGGRAPCGARQEVELHWHGLPLPRPFKVLVRHRGEGQARVALRSTPRS